jgi:hypothetical protein
MSDTLARDRFRNPSSIRAILDTPGADGERNESVDMDEPAGLETFSPDSTTYQAHARAGNKPLHSIHLILRDQSIRTCQYLHLESGSSFTTLPQGKGHRLTLRFSSSTAIGIVIEGRGLWRLYDYIAQHRMPWIYELPDGRDFEDARASVIRAIEFQELDPER